MLLQSAYNLRGVFFYAWVVAGLLFVLVLAVGYLRFTIDLPEAYRRTFILSMGLFFIGAIGTEMLTGWVTDTFRMTRTMDTVLTTLEETLELAGVILFIRFLLTYLGGMAPKVQISILDSDPGGGEGGG